MRQEKNLEWKVHVELTFIAVPRVLNHYIELFWGIAEKSSNNKIPKYIFLFYSVNRFGVTRRQQLTWSLGKEGVLLSCNIKYFSGFVLNSNSLTKCRQFLVSHTLSSIIVDSTKGSHRHWSHIAKDSEYISADLFIVIKVCNVHGHSPIMVT